MTFLFILATVAVVIILIRAFKSNSSSSVVVLGALAAVGLIGVGSLIRGSSNEMVDYFGMLFIVVGIGLFLLSIISAYIENSKHKSAVKDIDQTHGTARFANAADLQSYTTSQGGLYIGRYDAEKKQTSDLFFNEQGHILTVAGARSGKGVNLILPNLLDASHYKGSWVVIDPKGELAAITASHQQTTGRKVQILDPFKELQKQAEANPQLAHLAGLKSGSFNPLDVLDPENDDLTDDVQVFAEMIVPSSSGNDSHWSDRARSFITSLLLHMMTSQEAKDRTLFKLYEWLRLPQVDWIMLIQEMQASDALFGVIRVQGNEIMSLMETSEKEFGSIMSTARRYTDIFQSPAIIRATATSDLDIRHIAQEEVCLYLILPSDKLESHRVWLRLCLRMALMAVMRNKGHRVTFLMDEFHSLGHLDVIEKSMGRLPGYNVTLWPILQDLNQLKGLYKDSWETFIANSRVRQFFGVGDNFTAEYVSKKSGQSTVVNWNQSGDDRSYNASARPLLTAGEVQNSPDIMMFIDNLPLTIASKRPYYTWPEVNNNAKPNPYFVS